MKAVLKIPFLIFIIFSAPIISCRHIAYTKSDAKIISRTFDTSLKDSAMIYGKVYYAIDQKIPVQHADIWIDGSYIKTASDSAGNFMLKIIPGTYTIKCLGQFADPYFTMVIKDLSLTANEKVEISFLHGDKSE